MADKKKVAILTGSGVSTSSGIPPFNESYWKELKTYGGETDPLKILTRLFFDENPMAVWEWHSDLYKLYSDK